MFLSSTFYQRPTIEMIELWRISIARVLCAYMTDDRLRWLIWMMSFSYLFTNMLCTTSLLKAIICQAIIYQQICHTAYLAEPTSIDNIRIHLGSNWFSTLPRKRGGYPSMHDMIPAVALVLQRDASYSMHTLHLHVCGRLGTLLAVMMLWNSGQRAINVPNKYKKNNDQIRPNHNIGLRFKTLQAHSTFAKTTKVPSGTSTRTYISKRWYWWTETYA